MKLARYTHGNTPHASIATIGVVVDERVLPLSALDPAAPDTIRDVLAKGPTYIKWLAQQLEGMAGGYHSPKFVSKRRSPIHRNTLRSA